MSPLRRGLYEQILTDLLVGDFGSALGEPHTEELRNAEAADRIAWHLARVVERAIEALPADDRAELGAKLAGKLISQIAGESSARELRGSKLRNLRAYSGPSVVAALTAHLK
jgi:hypothetical protein